MADPWFDPDLYFEEFVRYYEMARVKQEECNFGTVPHDQSSVNDDLLRQVTLYDGVECRYEDYKQILFDMWHGLSDDHPYAHKLTDVKLDICNDFHGVTHSWELQEWIYVWIIHAVTGSGVDYSKDPPGYRNTMLPMLHGADDLEELRAKARHILTKTDARVYTSSGYYYPVFPLPPEGSIYRRGGDYYMCEFAPTLARELADFLEGSGGTGSGGRWTFREAGKFMSDWNQRHGLPIYHFHHLMILEDVANWRPDVIDEHSAFFYGPNAIESLQYITGGPRDQRSLDAAMDMLADATGGKPYDLEYVMCDWIKWIENYIRGGHAYENLDWDAVWSSSRIKDHPKGRQRAMLQLGLVDSFNVPPKAHPSDYKILNDAGWSLEEYQEAVGLLSD